MLAEQGEELRSLWDEARAPADPVDLLVYQSNLLGADPRITNFGGGNTSAKLPMADPLTGESVEVLWVKGSGGDLGSMKRAGLASLYQDKVLALERRFVDQGMHEDETVDLYPFCTFGLNPTAASIDTPLHAFVPKRYVNHYHADATIAIAAAEDAERLTRECYGDEIGYVPWKRPGFELGLQCRDAYLASPSIKGLIMGSHGIICWADDQREVYDLSLRLVNQAAEFIKNRTKDHPFGPVTRPQRLDDPPAAWVSLLPTLRGKVSHNGQRLIAHIEAGEAVLDFLSRAKMQDLTRLGTSCPDHFLRTKIAPMVLEYEGWEANLDQALAAYREGYAAYYARCKHADSPAMRNPNPSVVLIPGLGMVAFGKNKQEARVTAEFYSRAIEVMRGSEALSRYTALPEQEAFNIEYWWLEENKLRRQPPEKELSRQIAIVTGAAQGIGKATAKKLADLGASVVILDINADKLQEAAAELGGNVKGVRCDVTDAESLADAFNETILEFGGVDIVVVSAGNARRGTVADTPDTDYDFLSDLLMKAYFRTMRSASKVMIQQGTGGSMVIVASKNAVATGSNAAVYSAAKAFELHLTRTAASDLAKYGIRCNAVNPDAVIQGSGIWSDQWRAETATSLGIPENQLEEHYRKRSMLGVMVSTDDVAEAICWLASEQRSSRTTGAVIPVDGGIREGFLR